MVKKIKNKLNKNDKLLLKIKKEVVACQKCQLYQTRTLPVVGQGSHTADIIFIGEAPGKNEDLTGHPFCGRSGEILSELLKTINLKREDVYICNILKCRPPGNRNPLSSEIIACTSYLDRQIKIINPKVLCCLGNFATGYIFKKFGLKDEIQGISRIHGKVFNTKDRRIIPLYHPAVVAYNINMKDVLMKDFKMIKKIIG